MKQARYLITDIMVTAALVLGTFILLTGKARLSEPEMQVQLDGAIQQLGKVNLTDPATRPEVKLYINKAPQGGWHVQMVTKNFAFGDDKDFYTFAARGHAHLFVDGKSIGRVYDRLYNLTGLTVGVHRIDVFLENQSFNVYTWQGQPITDSLETTIEKKDLDAPPVMMKK